MASTTSIRLPAFLLAGATCALGGAAAPAAVAKADAAESPQLLAVFTFNAPTLPTFAADVDHNVGTPTVTFLGDNVLPSALDGNAFVDFDGTPHAAGDAYGYGGTALWTGNQTRLLFDREAYVEFTFSFDYRSTRDSRTGIGIRNQEAATYSLITSVDLVGDSAWHRVSYTFDLLSAMHLLAGSTTMDIGLGPSGPGSADELRLDNYQLVGFPEPTAAAAALIPAMLAAARRRGRRPD